ncbi:EAL domain-containing protein [Desulfovibrio sp. TomC]|uniref:EAL domain-containing protein n=1 Tax=Desulfovibrio sp. TomC TaxID=1562888 RepID=UPI000573C01B|nr:EAL domain-containing protein [Desulfovibrio sp. TomC]KHK03515.1 hypothetical protein NY78_1103 [Desulfovibrio sp. TomC]
MANTFSQTQTGCPVSKAPAASAIVGQGIIYFRALVDLGNGGVAGIEAARDRRAATESMPCRPVAATGRSLAQGSDALGAWGSEVREPAAYLVRGGLGSSAAGLGAAVGVNAGRVIIMYDVAALLADPARAIDTLVAAKCGGARVLLDNFDMDTPPARFMEMLPADILRVDPRQMPWHWDDAKRQEAMASLVHFAGNLLMDVAVEGVHSIGHRRELKQLGVRYGQGGWRRDTSGLVPDPNILV